MYGLNGSTAFLIPSLLAKENSFVDTVGQILCIQSFSDIVGVIGDCSNIFFLAEKYIGNKIGNKIKNSKI